MQVDVEINLGNEAVLKNGRREQGSFRAGKNAVEVFIVLGMSGSRIKFGDIGVYEPQALY